MDNAFSASSLFDLTKTIAAKLFGGAGPAWEVLPLLEKELVALGETLGGEYVLIKDRVWAHRSAKIAESATVHGPAIVCENAELRPGCYIRGSAIVGKNAVVGNSTEVKNAVLFDGVQVPHYNYVGDSVMGARSHLGAGAILSNVRLDKKNVVIKHGGEKIETGLRKLGALVGDGAQIGCNAVLNPGTVVGRNAVVYPLVNAGGVIGEGETVKKSKY